MLSCLLKLLVVRVFSGHVRKSANSDELRLLSLSVFVCMEQLGSHWAEFNEI